MSGSPQTRKSHGFYAAILVLITLWMSLPGIASMQVIDRDEARYVQATVQMVESGDYLNIKFQDRARNKKPAGIYWMQSAFVKAFTEPGERKIWTHRLVSVLGALLAVLSTYWGALAVLGRRGAFWSGAILATTLLMTFEAHIAKTDAMLCGFSALCLAALLRLQKGDKPLTALIFWIALGAAVMIKGPITPGIILVTVISFLIWQKELRWLRNLIHIPGIIIALLIVVPWAIAIGFETDGAFFREAIGGDLAPKIAGGQEKHGALPGYYLLTLPIFFWPGILLLVPGLVFAFKAARKNSGDEDLRNSVRLLLCWALPFWLILELVPTKLPNYPLPLYPALAIMAAGSFLVLSQDVLKKSFRIGSVLFLIIALLLTGAIFAADGRLAGEASPLFWISPGFILIAFAAVVLAWTGRVRHGVIAALALTALLTPVTYQFIFPRLSDLQIADRIRAEIPTNDGRIFSPHFTEPSLVYALGTDIKLGDKVPMGGFKAGDIILSDAVKKDSDYSVSAMVQLISDAGLCPVMGAKVDGTNYSKGDEVEIQIIKVERCAP